MGSLISCNNCPAAVQHTVITFSDDVVLKMTEGIEPQQLTPAEMKELEMVDHDGFERLRCIDRSHSVAYGLTVQSVNALFKSISKQMKKNRPKNLCDNDEVLRCYMRHPHCTIVCAPAVAEFIDCVEGTYMEKLAKKLEDFKTKKKTK
ncbi:PREDICTED: uncharacterized protein LOC108568014 [Nicrophorus vespilloides]|uniref:Uncharacterized protein LOC108568014 n=1 Tax=Nicrophorus vespilloides TaxID=110193 RepID=A0ABM1NBZ5_NICVS|nr:PREDICTED: uncharacterized protein LOC108568014 [Nicrophorus vespilloides]